MPDEVYTLGSKFVTTLSATPAMIASYLHKYVSAAHTMHGAIWVRNVQACAGCIKHA